MARSRNIKPGFFLNEDLVELPFSTRLLFIGLWTIADREGRLDDRPKKIKMAIFPADDVDVEKGLSELHGAGMVLRYVVDNEHYIQICNFTKHQNPHVNEQDSTIPAPDLHCACTVPATPLTSSLIPDSLNTDSPIPDNGLSDSGDVPPPKRTDAKILLPLDYLPDSELIAWARTTTPDIDPIEMLEEFVTFWRDIATRNNKRTMRGWNATWKNRMKDLQDKVKTNGTFTRKTEREKSADRTFNSISAIDELRRQGLAEQALSGGNNGSGSPDAILVESTGTH